METQSPADLRLAAHLAKPFLLPGQSGQPLSLRRLADGGMVVIAADGRKLWFTAREVGLARQKLNQPGVQPVSGDGIKLHDINAQKAVQNLHPPSKTREGTSELIVLPESLRHLKEGAHVNPGKHDKPRSATSG